MEVYCEKCVYRVSYPAGGDYCKKYHSKHQTPIRLTFPKRECLEVNRNNNCKAYCEKVSWYKKLLKGIQ